MLEEPLEMGLYALMNQAYHARVASNTQMLLYLPKDGSMLGLGGDKLILMCTYDCYLLGKDALSSSQCLQSMT